MLGAAYAWTQHGYLYPSWFNDPAVTPHLRSTSVGDLLATEDGALYVVESFGFQPYRPKSIGAVRSTTIGFERHNNPALFPRERESFVAFAVAGIDHDPVGQGQQFVLDGVIHLRSQTTRGVEADQVGTADVAQFQFVTGHGGPDHHSDQPGFHPVFGQGGLQPLASQFDLSRVDLLHLGP